MQSELEAAVSAARSAGQLLCDGFSRPHQQTYKDVISIVTEMDLAAERLIIESLKNAFPGYGFLGEESGRAGASNTVTWIIDPLDGTTNYAHGYPLFGVSIALEKDGQVALGAVYNPLRDEMFTAELGAGARLNGQPIHVSTADELGKTLLASGFPYDAWSNPVNNVAEWRHFITRVVSVRCDGVAALDLCHLAAGRLDGYWELDLEPWDMAAGALIVQEAGGVVTLADGAPYDPFQRSILASNARLHPAMLAVLQSKESSA